MNTNDNKTPDDSNETTDSGRGGIGISALLGFVPWRVRPEYPWIVEDDQGNAVANCTAPGFEADSYAAVIAATPNMLEIVDYLSGWLNGSTLDPIKLKWMVDHVKTLLPDKPCECPYNCVQNVVESDDGIHRKECPHCMPNVQG